MCRSPAVIRRPQGWRGGWGGGGKQGGLVATVDVEEFVGVGVEVEWGREGEWNGVILAAILGDVEIENESIGITQKLIR